MCSVKCQNFFGAAVFSRTFSLSLCERVASIWFSGWIIEPILPKAPCTAFAICPEACGILAGMTEDKSLVALFQILYL